MANTITAQEFAQIMRDAIAQIQPAAAAAPVVNVEAPAAPVVNVQPPDVLFPDMDFSALEQQVASVSDYLNPYRNMTVPQIEDEFRRIGLQNFRALPSDTQTSLSRQLNMVKSLDEQARALALYQTRTPDYISSDYSRISFDTFRKSGPMSPRGLPLEQSYKYLFKDVPEARIKFNPQTAMYEMTQDGKRLFAKDFRDAERWALMGGNYADAVKTLRDVRQKTEKREIDDRIIFKARKV